MKNIEIIGPGCPFCKTLYKRVEEVVNENGLDAQIEHIKDFGTFIRYFPRTPVLIVDGQVLHKGKLLPDKEKLKTMLVGG
jgi:small redox-active disulfide protein 2